MDRAEAIKRIKAGLESRSGKKWSVTGGRGTAYGWLSINAPPAKRTWRYVSGGQAGSFEMYDSGEPGHYSSQADRDELTKLLDLPQRVHCQGESVPSSGAHYDEYVARAEGRKPERYGEMYWD